MARVRSVNLGARSARPARGGRRPVVTGIDKRPAAGPVELRAPGPKGVGGSGLVGDDVVNRRHHGGDDQAVYAYAGEDLDDWAVELGRALPPGSFGENLTLEGVDVSGARIGERWRVGAEVVLEVSVPRIPCRTFAEWLDERGWIRRFTERAAPGTYLRVLVPGTVRAGDPVEVVWLPDHDVTVSLAFRALTREPDLLGLLLAADALPDEAKRRAARRTAVPLDAD